MERGVERKYLRSRVDSTNYFSVPFNSTSKDYRPDEERVKLLVVIMI